VRDSPAHTVRHGQILTDAADGRRWKSVGVHVEPRSSAEITLDDLRSLAEIAAADRADRFLRRPRWGGYADRVLCVALCQGAALHYIDGKNGVKDFDVYTSTLRTLPSGRSHRGGVFPLTSASRTSDATRQTKASLAGVST
jgi:hypothetical protein